MRLALVLHIYQPSTQFPEITETIAKRSYRLLCDLLKKYPNGKITLNIAGSLTEQLANLGFESILSDLYNFALEGRVELVASAKYHPLLPKLPFEEVLRQIKINNETNRQFFKAAWKPLGFWSPELAYSKMVGKAVESAGFSWILLDESAHPRAVEEEDLKERVGEELHEAGGIHDQIYQLANSNLKVFFRDREASVAIAFSQVKTLLQLLSSFQLLPLRPLDFARGFGGPSASKFQVLAMDGETFGFHRPEQVKLLEELLAAGESSSGIELVTVSDLLTKDYPKVAIGPLESSWGTTLEELKRGRIFPRWDNPDNPIHRLQWELLNLALSTTKYLSTSNLQSPTSNPWRYLLDQGLQSDQFWWASHNPCWHPPMIERGAKLLRESILQNPATTNEEKEKAQALYNQIIETGKKLFGEEIIAC